MTRIALGVSYTGTTFHGWQFQNEALATVQADIQRALSQVANHPVTVTCAGRTDAGVHATNQVLHFDSDSDRSLKAWIHGANANLSPDIAVNWARQVAESFDARHSATGRRYLYLVFNHKVRSGLLADLVTRDHRPLNADRMHQSAQALTGELDFSSFRAAHCQSRSPMRNVRHLRVFRSGELVVLDIAANAFLHHMVRNIAGVLLDVGAGIKSVDWPEDLLNRRDRTQGGVTAPPNGLFLVQVDYPDYPEIPAGPRLPHLFHALPIV